MSSLPARCSPWAKIQKTEIRSHEQGRRRLDHNLACQTRDRSIKEIVEEIEFLLGDGEGSGQRVELNAMTSPQFIAWLERKLKKHHVGKFVPDDSVLETAFKRAWLTHRLNRQLNTAFVELRREADKADVPDDLRGQVLACLRKSPGESWDQADAHISLTV